MRLADVVPSEVRSRMMAGIRGANTNPEMLLRRGLHGLGWRYRLHERKLIGKPDLVFPGRRALVFVNGCFWHGHDCHLFKWPKTRVEFWCEKISGNIARDLRGRERLLSDGWRIADVWECRLKGREREPLQDLLARCDEFLRSEEAHISIGSDRRVEVPTPPASG